MGMLTNCTVKEGKWVNLDWENIDNTDVIEAGTPIGADGLPHNDAFAIGLLLKSCDRRWNAKGEIMIEGRIDESERQTLTGVTLSDACRNALHLIQLQQDGKNLPFVSEAVAGTAYGVVAG
mgnify:CR=1 FL=1